MAVLACGRPFTIGVPVGRGAPGVAIGVRGVPPVAPTLRGLSVERTPLLRTPAGRAPSVLRTVPLVRPASRPLTPAWRVAPTVLPVLRGLLLERTELLLEREGLL